MAARRGSEAARQRDPLRRAFDPVPAGAPRPFSYASYPFKGIERYISEHIADKVNAETLAANFGYERSYFSRKFKSVFSLSPGEYIKIIRLSRAASLLKYGASIDSVCAQLGYADKKVFSRAFKAYTGVCPSKYEKNHKMQP